MTTSITSDIISNIIKKGEIPMKRKNDAYYIELLQRELTSALGCTEPGALAYAAASVVQVLGSFPRRIRVKCSGNII